MHAAYSIYILQGTFEIQRKKLNGTERENKKTKKYLFQRKALGKVHVKNIKCTMHQNPDRIVCPIVHRPA